ncbi:MaoC family dehydratase N-terminal domain-containing protein [Streptomyces sp. NBC_00147]|uniref:MaoC family dehydratase N-terminal domain-containing protein n=1 Tax=Streptomyces sp. NBC_00147 TaxID=2975667 RepID=UPI0032550E7C
MSTSATTGAAKPSPTPLINPSVIGTCTPPHTALVEAGRLRQFAHAIGERRPEYVDEDAARAASRPGLLVPPTFLFCLEMDHPDPWGWLTDLEVDLATVLHAEQSFVHHQPAWSGQRLTFTSRITDVTVKSGGALQFVVRETHVTDEHGAVVADLSSTLAVVRPTAPAEEEGR